MKPVYFNSANPKEKEILDWLDNKFSSFGGMVKDLLYQEMLREKNGVGRVVIETTNEALAPVKNEIQDDEENTIKDTYDYVDASDVEDYDC